MIGFGKVVPRTIRNGLLTIPDEDFVLDGIRSQAYKLWQQGHSDDAVVNWLEAERLVLNALAKMAR